MNPPIFEAAARGVGAACRCAASVSSTRALGYRGYSVLLFGMQSISEVDADKWFVPNDPRVVPRRNRPHIAWTKLCFGPVVHADHYPPRENVDEVANLATVGPNSQDEGLCWHI